MARKPTAQKRKKCLKCKREFIHGQLLRHKCDYRAFRCRQEGCTRQMDSEKERESHERSCKLNRVSCPTCQRTYRFTSQHIQEPLWCFGKGNWSFNYTPSIVLGSYLATDDTDLGTGALARSDSCFVSFNPEIRSMLLKPISEAVPQWNRMPFEEQQQQSLAWRK